MLVTYLGYVRFRQKNTTYQDSRKIIPGDHVEISDEYSDFFESNEVVQAAVKSKSVQKREAIMQAAAATPEEQYETIVKSQITETPRAEKSDDDFILDLPDVREKVRKKFESKKAKSTKAKKKSSKKKKGESNKGLKKCKTCGRFKCQCEK